MDTFENALSFLPSFSFTSGISLTENPDNQGLISRAEAVEGNDKAVRIDIDAKSALTSPVTATALVGLLNLVRVMA
jgi:hypothetical protein